MLLLFVFCLAALLVGTWLWYAAYVTRPGPQAAEDQILVSIPKGTSVKQISKILSDAGVIHDDLRFLILARLSGLGKKLQAGEFHLPAQALPEEVLKTLASARSVEYSITLPEGLRAKEIARVFEEGGWCDPRSFDNLVTDSEFITSLGLEGVQNLEGYLFPDTYLLTSKDKDARKIVTLLVKRFLAVWSELLQGVEGEVNRHEVVILASMVEKETGEASERPRIAGVFHHRIQKGMRLQSDPTVSYGLQKFGTPISRKDLRSITPYNTYTLPGLPIGPICNPGREALFAVLHPEKTKELYFVARNDGTHQFSKNLRDHNIAVRKYQRKKSGEKGK